MGVAKDIPIPNCSFLIPNCNSHVDAEIFAQCCKSAAEAGADGVEFPLALIAIKFADNNSRLD